MTERLCSWKEIATHLNITVRTAQRWEKTEQLPVHRHRHSQRHSVYAFRSELDQWWHSRGASLPQPPAQSAWPSRFWLAFAALGAAAAISVAVWIGRPTGQPRLALLAAVPLTSLHGHEIFPALSPDAGQVAFSWDGEHAGSYDIYVSQLGHSADPRRLTSDVQQDFSPAWSPDGREIAFVRRQPGNRADVVVVGAAGDGPERKVAGIYLPTTGGWGHAGQGRFLTWSPDGRWLAAAAADSPDGAFHLILVSPETGETRNLTETRDQFTGDVSASFSPDGRTLAFSRSTSATFSEIHLLELSSDHQPRGIARQLTSLGQHSTSPAWTSDGREVVFIAGTTPAEVRLWKVAPSGGEPNPVEVGHTPVTGVTLAGDRLVFSQGSGDVDIWCVDLPTAAAGAVARAGSPVRLASSTRPDGSPQFSPDGTMIAFGSHRSGHREIYVANRDGSNSLQLSRFGGPPVQSPSWSPSGKQLAFMVSSSGSVKIYTVGADGGTPRVIHSDPAAVTASGASFLSWSRDGNWIYFVSRRSGTAESWKAPVIGGTAVQVTAKGGLAARESPDGRFVYYLKGPAPFSLWRIPAGGGEEHVVLARVSGAVAFSNDGLYFITRDVPSGSATLRFFSLSTETATPIAEIGVQGMTSGFSVSSDQRRLIYSQSDSGNIDLMLVDRYR